MKALVTGGAGFIGLRLCNKLIESGYEVVILDNFSRGKEDRDLRELSSVASARVLKVDLLKVKDVAALGKDFNLIFHLAAIIGVANVVEKPYRVLVDNVNMLSQIIQLARLQTSLDRLLFASTSEIYAGSLESPIGLIFPTPEDSTLVASSLERPRSSYMLSKLYGEAMCHQSGLPFTIFRPHNIYGPRMGMNHVIPELLNKFSIYEGTGDIHIASPDHSRCFCYIDDAIEMIYDMSINSDCCNNTFNVGNGDEEVSIKELAFRCMKIVGKEVTLCDGEVTQGSPFRRVPDMSHLQRFIGKKKYVGLAEGISRTYDWYKLNIFDESN
jgi:UDP-glucose 4-epimerase